ncbi:MAG: DEAD/DEAH box helicase, partial [Nitrospinota bacterium]
MKQFIRGILEERHFAETLAHSERLPARGARYGEAPSELDTRLRGALSTVGFSKLYAHQVRALELALGGANVVAVAPAGSGKSLSFHLPVFQHLLREPGSFALYLYPLKALAQDQLRSIRRLADALGGPLAAGGELGAEVYDGDTPESRRKKLRQRPPRILITNPDMLHHGVLPSHEQWGEFFGGLRAVVVDELHTYRGIFGGHIGLLLRRLRRVCRHYGSEPQFLASSATLSNAAELAERLTGLPFAAVEENGAPRAARHFLMLNP